MFVFRPTATTVKQGGGRFGVAVLTKSPPGEIGAAGDHARLVFREDFSILPSQFQLATSREVH
jgi:hypothetical protein